MIERRGRGKEVDLSVRVISLIFGEDPFERLHGEPAGLLDGDGEIPGDDHAFVVRVAETELDLGFDFFLSGDLRSTSIIGARVSCQQLAGGVAGGTTGEGKGVPLGRERTLPPWCWGEARPWWRT
jgi:hypothetical protein